VESVARRGEGEFVAAAELAEAFASFEPPILRADLGPISRVAWEHHRGRIAVAVRDWRRRHPDEFDRDRILVDRIAALLDSLDAILQPSAGALVAAGLAIDDALEHVDRHVAQLHPRMAGRP